jgi:hypothetical protein
MALCSNCGLPTGNKHQLHDSLKECVAACKEAVLKLARYRLLEGDEEKMSEQLRQETLELAMKVHSKEVHNAVSDTTTSSNLLVAKQRYP